MNRRTLILLLGLAAAIVLVVAIRALDRDPAAMEDVHDLGSEALSQIYGSADGGAESSDGSGADRPAAAADAAVAGQVLLPNGEPAAGAVITAMTPGEPTIHEASADSGGMFAFPHLPEAVYVVEASLAGYGPAIALGVRTGQSRLRLVLQSGRSIQGLVTRDEQPVPHAVIHVGGAGLFPQRAVVADSRGRFVLAGLRPGRYEMLATAPGASSGFGGRIAVDDAEGESMRMDVPLYAAPTTHLDVVDGRSGEPVSSAVVTIAEGPLHVLAVNESVRGGTASVDYLPRGEYHLRVRSPGYLPFEGRFRVHGDGARVRVPLSSGATVRGVVRDTVGNTLAIVSLTAVVRTPDGARWELRQSLFDEFHRLVRPDGTPFWMPAPIFRTDTDGTFTLSGLPVGTARVIASKPGWATEVSNELTLDADRVYEPLELTMSRGRRLRGRVEDGAGGAVSGAFVSVHPPQVPAWAAPVGLTTQTNGVFEFEDLPAQVVLTVRHPDFAAAELRLDVPETGLDDVIVRLSGEQLPMVGGRLFTSRGRPAVGALIWLMAGSSELPACQATVGADGWFRATHCSSVPERLVASYAEHAPLRAELAGDGPRDWTLPVGGEVEVLSRGTPVVVTIEPLSPLPQAHWPRPQIGLDSWSRDLVRHVAPGPYRVTCRADEYEPGTVNITVVDGQRAEAACPNMSRIVEFDLVVVDPQGAPVPDAVVFVDRVDPPIRTVSDARGRLMIRTRPGVWLAAEAMHERWGRGALEFFAHYHPRDEPPRIVLAEPIGGPDSQRMISLLDGWGVVAVADGNSMLVDSVTARTPAAGIGLRRLDSILWARPTTEFRFSIGVRREGELLTFELVREPDAQ